MYQSDYRPDAPWALDMNNMTVRGTVDKVLMFLIESDNTDAANAIRREFDF